MPTSPRPALDLVGAIEARNVQAVKKLLKSGADANQKDAKGRSALALAFAKQADEVALLLLDAGADIKSAPLNPYWAASTGRADVVKNVLAAGGDPNFTAIGGPALRVAARRGDVEMIQAFLDAGADPNIKGASGNSLDAAIGQGHAEAASLLIRAGASLKSKTDDSLLVQAVHRKMTSTVRAMIDAGADVNERAEVHEVDRETFQAVELYSNGTPLLIAARLGLVEIAKMLLEAGADAALRDDDGRSAIDLASANGHGEIVSMLQKRIEAQPKRDDAALDLLLASEAGDVAKVKQLLTKPIDPNTRDDRKRCARSTPLLHACANGHVEVATLLLAAKADPSRTDADESDPEAAAKVKRLLAHTNIDTLPQFGMTIGRSPLGEAAANGNVPLVELLLKHGAPVEQLDLAGRSPLMRACGKGHAEVARQLMTVGADVNRVDLQKEIPLSLAVDARSEACVKLLLDAGAKLPKRKDLALLSAAARVNDTAIIDLLLRAGANVDQLNSVKQTALFVAAESGHLDAVKRLLAGGANVNARDGDGTTPLIRAATLPVSAAEWENHRDRNDPLLYRRIEMCRVLLDAGADVNAVETRSDGKQGFSAIVMAAIVYNDPLVAFLLDRGADPTIGLCGGDNAIAIARSHRSSKALIARMEAAPKAEPVGRSDKSASTEKVSASMEPRKKKAKAELPEPPPFDFAAVADREPYRKAIAELEKQTKSKRQPFPHLPSAYRFHIDSRASFDFEAMRSSLRAHDIGLIWTDVTDRSRIAVYPTADPYEILRANATNGANYDLGPEEIIAWLRDLQAKQPWELTAAGHDFVEGRFLDAVKEPQKLARAMYKFCPDIVDQGVGSVKELATELARARKFFFWWD
jgi:ankyrin repeat protein